MQCLPLQKRLHRFGRWTCPGKPDGIMGAIGVAPFSPRNFPGTAAPGIANFGGGNVPLPCCVGLDTVGVVAAVHWLNRFQAFRIVFRAIKENWLVRGLTE